MQQDAYQDLANKLCHQGTVYQATGYAVPFLLRMLQAEEMPDKAGLLALLQNIATGLPYLTKSHRWMEAVLAEEGRSFQTEVELARGYAQRAHDAVDEGLDIYLDLLDDQDPDTREWAFALLCVLPEHAGRTVPILLARLRKEPEPDRKARLVEHLGFGLAGLLPDGQEEPVTEQLEWLVGSGETGMGLFAAAVALTHILGAETPSIAVDVLEGAVAHPEGLYLDAGLERNEPAVGETLVVEEACAALSRLDPEQRIAVLLRSLGEISVPEHAHRVALLLLDSALLDLARVVGCSGIPEATEEAVSFAVTGPRVADGVQERVYPRAEAPLEVASFTPGQVQAVQAVLDSPAVWAVPSNLFELYGLPASSVVVRELLQ